MCRGTCTQLKCQVMSRLLAVSFSPTKLSSSCPLCDTGTCLRGFTESHLRRAGVPASQELLVFRGHIAPAFPKPQQCPGHQQGGAQHCRKELSHLHPPITAGPFCCWLLEQLFLVIVHGQSWSRYQSLVGWHNFHLQHPRAPPSL